MESHDIAHQALRRWQMRDETKKYKQLHQASADAIAQKERDLHAERKKNISSLAASKEQVQEKYANTLSDLLREQELIRSKIESVKRSVKAECLPIEICSSESLLIIQNELTSVQKIRVEDSEKYATFVRDLQIKISKPFDAVVTFNYIPEDMLVALLPYQIETLNRIIDCYVNMKQFYPLEVYRSVVGNRVGSGKTRICLFVAWILSAKFDRHVNIIVPGTLVNQYEHEIVKLEAILPGHFHPRFMKTVKDEKKCSQRLTIINARYLINYRRIPNRGHDPFTIVDEIPTMDSLENDVHIRNEISLKFDLILSATWKQEISEDYDEFYFEASDEFIERSYSTAKVIETVIECSGLTDKILVQELGPDIIRLLKTGDTMGAIALIGGDSLATTFEDALTWKFNKMIQFSKARIIELVRRYTPHAPVRLIEHNEDDEDANGNEEDEEGEEINDTLVRLGNISITGDTAGDNVENEDEDGHASESEIGEGEDEDEEVAENAFNDSISVFEKLKSGKLAKVKQQRIEKHIESIAKHSDQKDRILERVRATSCPICLSSNAIDRVVTNCAHTFCRDCIDSWIHRVRQQPFCPICKCKPLTYTVVHKEGSVGKPSKQKAIQNLVSDHPNDSFIIFSESDRTFEMDLENSGIKFRIHRGNSFQLARAVQDLRNNKIRVLCVNTTRSATGLDLGFVDQIINYHAPNSLYERIQTIGRCQRLGRTKDIIVTTLSISE